MESRDEGQKPLIAALFAVIRRMGSGRESRGDDLMYRHITELFVRDL